MDRFLAFWALDVGLALVDGFGAASTARVLIRAMVLIERNPLVQMASFSINEGDFSMCSKFEDMIILKLRDVGTEVLQEIHDSIIVPGMHESFDFWFWLIFYSLDNHFTIYISVICSIGLLSSGLIQKILNI